MQRHSLPASIVAVSLGLSSALCFAEEQEDAAALFADTADGGAAADAASSTSAASALPTLMLRLSGAHSFDYHQPAYDDALNYDGEMKAPAFRNDIGIEVKSGELKLVSRWALDALMLQDAPGADASSARVDREDGSWDALARLRPLENFVSYAPSALPLSLAFGYQVIAWGAADKINPTDNLNPRDYTTGVIDPTKIPVLAAQLNWYPTAALQLQAVLLPHDGSDRWPVDFANETRVATGTNGAVGYRELGNGPKQAVGGGRLACHGSAGDASLSYLYDFDSYYSPRITGALYAPASSAAIDLERRRVHRIGADGKVGLGNVGLWAEVSATIRDRADSNNLRKDRLDYVAGIDTSYGPNGSYYLNLQYFGTKIFGFDDSSFDEKRAMDLPYAEDFYRRNLANALGFETEGLLQGVAASLKWDLWDGVVVPQLKAVYIVPFLYDDSQIKRYGSAIINPEIDLMPVDSFHVLFGAHLAYAWIKELGNDDIESDTSRDRFGVYTPYNNVYLKVQYRWTLDITK